MARHLLCSLETSRIVENISMLPDRNAIQDSCSDPILLLGKEIAEIYLGTGEPVQEIQFLTSSENRTYRIRCPHATYAMRVQRPGYHSEAEINAELEFVDILAKHGVSIAKPLARRDGAFVSRLRGGQEDHLITLFHWVNGRHPEEHELPEVYASMGAIMGRMHSISERLGSQFASSRPHWGLEEIIGATAVWGNWDHPSHISQNERGLVYRFLEVFQDKLSSCTYPLRRGLIHADMRPTNVMISSDRITMIDFDDCCHSWFLFDIAAAFSFLEHRPGLTRWVNNFLEGYQTTYRLSSEDISLLPYFIGLRRVQLMAWYFSHIDSEFGKSLGIEWLHESFAVLSGILEQRLVFSI